MKQLCAHRGLEWDGGVERNHVYDKNLERSEYEEMLIGKGNYGDVFVMVSRTKPEEVYAVKVSRDSQRLITTATVGDLSVRNMSHPNISGVCKVGWFSDRRESHFAMFMDRANMNLAKYIELMHEAYKGSAVSASMFDDRKIAAFQVANSIAYLASVATLHCDIKSENFLVSGFDGGASHVPRVMLTDFGLALPFATKSPASRFLYSLWWRAPEILLGSGRGTMAAEVWACGCVIYELLTFKQPFGTPKTEYEQMVSIARTLKMPTGNEMPALPRYEFWNLWKDDLARDVGGAEHTTNTFKEDLVAYPGAYDLLTRMLDICPKSRPTIYQVLDHPFFSAEPMRDPRLFPKTTRDYVYRTIPDTRIERVPLFDAGKRVATDSAISMYRRMQRKGPVFKSTIQTYELYQSVVRGIYGGWRKTTIGGFETVFVAVDLARAWFSTTNHDLDKLEEYTWRWQAAFLNLASMYVTKTPLTDAMLLRMFHATRAEIELLEGVIAVEIDFDIHRPSVCTLLEPIVDKNMALFPEIEIYNASYHFALMVMGDSEMSSGMQCYDIACQTAKLVFGPGVAVKDENDDVIERSDVFFDCVAKHFEKYIEWITGVNGISQNGLNALVVVGNRWGLNANVFSPYFPKKT
jgi:serine/threonine protein kinase